MVSYVIMAHPSRAHFVPSLEAALPDATVVWDERSDRWDTGRRSMLAGLESGADHVCVVQDDAILSQEFVSNVAALTMYSGEHPVGLYVGSSSSAPESLRWLTREAESAGSPWFESSGPWWGVGIVFPAAHIEELVRWGDTRPEVANYDRRIGRWYDLQKIQCLYTWPSLVNHRPVSENPSLVEGRTANRQAQFFNTDGRLLDWERDPVVLQKQMSFRHHRNGRTITVNTDTERFVRLVRSPVWVLVKEAV